MKKIDSSFFDSSAWLAYCFEAAKRTKDLIESESVIYTSALSLFEVKKKLAVIGTDTQKINEVCGMIQSRSIIIPIDWEIAEGAVDYALQNKLGAIDALIYASARSVRSILITADLDFNGMPETEIIRQN